MKKVRSMWLVIVLLFVGLCVVQSALLAAEEKPATAQAVPQVKIEPAAPTAPSVAKAEAADVAAPVAANDDVDVLPAADDEVDDVAVLKQAADELQKAGKTDLAKKVRDIAEGLDW